MANMCKYERLRLIQIAQNVNFRDDLRSKKQAENKFTLQKIVYTS